MSKKNSGASSNKPHDFQVLLEMSDRNLDVKTAPLSNIHEIESKDGVGFVTFGIPSDVAMKLALFPEEFVGCFVLADRKEFVETQQTIIDDWG